jgi:hypothetical protein
VSFPYNNWMHRSICAAVLLSLAAAGVFFVPRTTNLAREDLATLTGDPVGRTTRLVDLAHAPATGQAGSIPLLVPGDRLEFGGHSEVDIPVKSLAVTPDATVGQVLQWISASSGWPARVGQAPRPFFAGPMMTDTVDDWPQFQFGSPNVYRFVAIHRLDAWPLIAAAAVAWAVAIWAALMRKRQVSHG